MTEMKEVTLTTLHNGAVTDLFNEKLREVVANIEDVNTEPDAVRKITITVAIKPDKTRHAASTKITAATRLAGIVPHEGYLFLDVKDGHLVALEDAPGPTLFEDNRFTQGNPETKSSQTVQG